MSRDVCQHFNPVDQPCDQCNSETRQTLELALTRHANLIRQIFNAAITPRKPVELTDWDIDRVTDQQWAQHDHKPIYAAHRAYARAVIAAYEAKQGEQT